MTGPARVTGFDAIVVTGGRAGRMGGVDKAALVVGGRTLGASVAGAVIGARRVIVVGPVPPEFPEGTIVTTEVPPGGGPVAAVAAGVAHVTAGEVVLLAVDLPFVTEHAVDALRAARGGAAAAMAVDGDGRDQPLCSLWRTAALRAALAALGEPAGVAMHRLVAAAGPITRLDGHAGAWFDCDTPADVAEAASRATRAARR